MSSHERRPTTLSERLSAALIFIQAATTALITSLTSASAYKPHAWPFRRIFLLKLIRRLGPLQTAPYGQSLSPTTGEAVRSACKKHKWPLIKSHHLSCGSQYADATLHEITMSPSSTSPTEPGMPRRAFLYLHGGGYLNPLSAPAHMPSSHAFAQTLSATHLFILEYSLTPAQIYPTQLAQAIAALSSLLSSSSDFNFTPEEIILGGDSAGGNLVLALLAHIIQPHPDCPPLVLPPQMQSATRKFAGALLISPWVTMHFTTPSCKANSTIDLLSFPRMAHFKELFKPKEGDVWADMLAGNEEFWAKIPVQRVLLTAGGLEMFRDDVVEMTKRLSGAKRNGTEVKLVVADGEVHDQTVLDFALATKQSRTTVAIYEWCLNIARGS